MNDLIIIPPSQNRGLQWMRPPVMGICRNPLLGSAATQMHEIPVGVRLRDFVIEADGPVVCQYNGEWLLREHWDEKTKPGDVIVWCAFPQGRETVRLLLTVAAAVISIAYPVLAPYAAAAVLAFNLLVPPRQPNLNNDAPGSIFSIGLSGNAARLDQAIWKNCGHVKITPPFAAIPYFINRPREGAEEPLLDQEQYGYFLYAVGIGDHEIVREFIGKTPLTSYQDVIVASYLAPGEQPSTVEANVLTSTEVSELELATDENGDGIYVGGYVACRPRDKVVKIGIDISAPQGLGHVTSSGSQDLVVAWQIDIREIDDFGIPVGEWVARANESIEMDTNSPQRWSYEYELSAPMRCEVRAFRTNVKNPDSDARDQINWASMRAWLEASAPLNPVVAHYEMVIRAGKQLSPDSQRDFSLIVNGMCPIYDPDTLTWSAPTVTRNPAWWLADLWRDTAWGEGLPDSRLDLDSLVRLAATSDERQDHFDYSFNASIDAGEAAQLIGRSCRSRASSPLGLRTVTRDELVAEPFAMFSSRNTKPDSIAQGEDLATRDRPDAIIVTYQDHVRWDLQEIVCWVPGADIPSDGEPINPFFFHEDGITGSKQAEREGLYMAAKVAYRGVQYELTTEMEGFLLRHMDSVRVQPDLPEFGQSGDVKDWDEVNFAMVLSEPADFSESPIFITLRRDDGSLTEPVEVTAGPTAETVILPGSPDFAIVVDAANRERPIFFLGPMSSDELCKVEEISDGGEEDGAQMFDVKLVIDDPRVHAIDNALLPGPGEIQDPIDDGTDIPSSGGGGSTALLVRLSGHTIGGGNIGTPDATYRGGIAQFDMNMDGSAGFAYSLSFLTIGSPTTGLYDREWINIWPVEPADAALFDVLVDDLGGVDHFTSTGAVAAGMVIVGTFNTWLPMTTDYSWSITADDDVFEVLFHPPTIVMQLKVKIRRHDSLVIQANRTINLILTLGLETPP